MKLQREQASRKLDADCGCISDPNILEQKQGETHCEIMVHGAKWISKCNEKGSQEKYHILQLYNVFQR